MNEMEPTRILFLCTANSCRSQMAEGLLRHLSGGTIEVASAGTHPKTIHPDAIRCMAEIGIDISAQRAKSLDLFLGEHIDYVITVCDQAKESCPLFPGAAESLHWSVLDPALAQGTEEERMRIFRQVREELKERIEELLKRIALKKQRV
ncbi:MAG: arsenate reductase ArsC [Acidobacteria bacterium]|nr:arsenate reductase ArsC [Acidobacteriota bacterium]